MTGRWGPDTGRDRLARIRPAMVARLREAIVATLEKEGGPVQAGSLSWHIKDAVGWESPHGPDNQNVAAVWRQLEREGVLRSYADESRRWHPLMVMLVEGGGDGG